MYDLDRLRQTEFPLSQEHIYFNHAGISPLPARVQARLKWSTDRLAAQPALHFHEDGLPMFESFGQILADLINAADPQEITPITSTSAGLSAVALAIDWQPGDNVLFCDVEFPSNAFPWLSMAQNGVEVRQLPARRGGLTLEALERFVDDKSRLVAVSAIQFFTGHRADLAAIGDFCRERQILFVVDAIQAIGHIPIDVQQMGIDILATGGQKSLLAPPGVGFMYIREAVCEQLRPRIPGPNATVDFLHWLDYDLTPLPGALRFLTGTPNITGMFALLESVGLLNELGIANIDRHTRRLAVQAMERLAGLGYEVITPAERHGPIVTFKLKGDEAATDELVEYLAQNRATAVKHLDRAGRPHVRLSFHCYNTSGELNRFFDLLEGRP